MTATLYFSNRIEKLADRLVENLRRFSKTADPFNPITIIVPNANLAKWLQLALSRRQPVVFNLQFIFLEEGLARMLSSEGSSSREEPTAFLDVAQRSLQVLFALKNGVLDQSSTTPFFNYLFDSDGVKRPDYALRIWQLSRRLARLFQEYEYHRQELITCWLEGKPHPETDRLDSAGPQRTLYLWIHKRYQKVVNHTGFQESFFDYGLKAGKELKRSTRNESGAPWHFFGLSHLSRFHLQLMDLLQPHFPLHLYTLNPCREYWEDIPSATELRHHRKKGQDIDLIPVEHGLLSAWGRPGRDTMAMLCQLTGYEIKETFTHRYPETVLGRLQQSLLTLSSPSSRERLPQDRSIQIAACPGRRREVETVYNTIVHNLATQDDLKLTDIAVLVADMDAYLPYIELVFNGLFPQSSYNLVDSGTAGQSHYGQALLTLFKLVQTKFNRKTVFSFLQNPCVMHRFNITQAELADWAKWVTGLGIFQSPDDGSNNEHSKAWATRPFGWQQGLLRLRLGRIFSVAQGGDSFDVEHYQSLEPYSDIESGNADAVEHFCQVMETLFGVCDRLRRPVKRTAEWSERLGRACRQTLSIPDSFPGETHVQRKLFEALTHLESYDLVTPSNGVQTALPLDFDEVKNYLKMTVRSLSGGRGDYLTSGVTIAELAPMRPIPFKIIFALGLEAGQFPGRPDLSTLDLRRIKRQTGDVTRPERQRYLFLEMLLSVRKKLYLSYVSRDLDKDREQAPSSMLMQLQRFIENELLPAGDRFEFQQIPLNGFSAHSISEGDVNPTSDLLARQTFLDRLAGCGFYDLWPQISEQSKGLLAPYGYDELWPKRVVKTETSQPTHTYGEPAPENLGVVALDELRRFLLNPVQQIEKKQLGAVGRDFLHELHIASDEAPLYAEYPFRWRMINEVLNRAVEKAFLDPGRAITQSDVTAILDAVYTGYLHQNRVPPPPFGAADKSALAAIIFKGVANAQKLLEAISNNSVKYRRVVMGEAGYHDAALKNPAHHLTFPATKLECHHKDRQASRAVTLKGSQDFLWLDQTQYWHMLVTVTTPYMGSKFHKQLLNAALFYLAAKAGKVSPFQDSKGVYFYLAADNGLFRAKMTVNARQAEKYLSRLVLQYTRSQPPCWLPWDVIQTFSAGPFEGQRHPPEDTPQDDFKKMLFNAFEKASIENQGLLESVITEDAWDIALGRFAIFPRLERVDADHI